jgi:hypothetical protein
MEIGAIDIKFGEAGGRPPARCGAKRASGR